MNFEDLFKAFERKATSGSPIGMELLVANAPLRIYYGISPQGFYRLAFMSQVVPPDFPSTRAIKVSVVKESDEAHWIFFDLVDGVAQPVYFTFCEDLSGVVSNMKGKDGSEAVLVLKNRYLSWRAMFRQERSPLSEEQIIGLLGELYFLKNYMIPRYGAELAIPSWSGVDGMNKDFSVNEQWFEVKTVSVNATTVKISSLAQLSSDKAGALIVVRYEQMSDSYDDPECSVYKLFRAIMKTIADEDVRAAFMMKLIAFGFDVSGENYGHRYRIVDLAMYRVDDKFPRIKESDVKYKEIDKVMYSLIINSLENFKFNGDL